MRGGVSNGWLAAAVGSGDNIQCGGVHGRLEGVVKGVGGDEWHEETVSATRRARRPANKTQPEPAAHNDSNKKSAGVADELLGTPGAYACATQ